MEEDLELFLFGSKGFTHFVNKKSVIIYFMMNLVIIFVLIFSIFNFSEEFLGLPVTILIISLFFGLIIFDSFYMKGIVLTILLIIGSTNGGGLYFDYKDIKYRYKLDLKINRKLFLNIKKRFDKEFGEPIYYNENDDRVKFNYSKNNKCVYNKRKKLLTIKRRRVEKKDLDVIYYNILQDFV